MRHFSLILLGTLASQVFAATTGTLVLQGIVPQVLNLSVSADAQASALDLTTSPVDLIVGTVQEQTNSQTGYEIYVSSANGGKLLQQSGDDELAYNLKYGDTAVNFSSSAAVVDQSTPDGYNVSRDVKISYTGKAATEMIEGTYSDTVTFTIQVKN